MDLVNSSLHFATIAKDAETPAPTTGLCPDIFLRGKGGGNVIGYVRLHSLSLITGRCEDPQCSFDNAFNDRACEHWEWSSWTVIQVTSSVTGLTGNVAALRLGLLAGTLKTDLLMATGTQTACLQFYYRMTGVNDTLAASVQHEDGITELMWQVTNHDESNSWSSATVPLFSDNAFFIIFQGQRCHTGQSTDIAIDDVRVFRNSPQCRYIPQGSEPSSQQLISTLDPRRDLPTRTTTSVITTRADSLLPNSTTSATTTRAASHLPTTTTSTNVTQRETFTTASAANHLPTPIPDDSLQAGSTTPAIVGAVAGVVVLAVAGLVIALVMWRMRKTNRSGLNTNKLSQSSGVGNGAMNNTEPSRKTAAAPDIPSATETHYEGLGELSPQNHYTSLVGTESASHAAASYYNIESTTQAGRNGPHRTSTAETQYEGLGEPRPPNVYTSLQNTAAASKTGTYYSNDFAQDNCSYYNVAPGNSAYYNVVKDPQNDKT